MSFTKAPLLIANRVEKLGMSYSEIARRLGVKPFEVRRVVRGERSISAPDAIAFEKVLGIPADAILIAQINELLARATDG